jgi:uncharacterized protein
MKMKPGKSFICLILAVLGLVLGIRFTEATTVPQLTGRVNDYAAMLSPATKQQLENVLAKLEQEDSTQLAVLTITSLEGAVLEEYSLKVAEAWRLGQKGRDNGALLLIAKNDRKLRIEVGYGLEGSLTDLTAGRIIRDIITPRFRDGNFDLGVSDGVAAMIAAVRGEFNGNEAAVAATSANNDPGGLIVFVAFAFFFLARIVGKHRWVAACIGAMLAPVFALLFLNFGWFMVLLLIPAGFISGFLASLIFGNMAFSSGRNGGSFGGFSSGGSSSGFSGGGGGFGGGGSSGGW